MMTFVTACTWIVLFSVLMTILTYCAVFHLPEMPLVTVHAVAMGVCYMQALLSDILVAFSTG